MARNCRSWLLDSKGFAKKVKGCSLPSGKQLKDCGAKRECPNCHFLINNSDVSHEWPGLPVGVKFDPSDIEILDHLAAKCGVGKSEPHIFIDEFIPTIDVEGGICHKHPEELPGSRKDGSSVHFFHRTTNAYTTGQRKRRKIHNEPSSARETVRWHKTGKTKPMIQNGIQKGCKKIMVLHSASVKGAKPEKAKANWVMHQYHLGTDEDEKEGQYVVSKIFYQAQKAEKFDNDHVPEESDVSMIQNIPRTPKTPSLDPPRPVMPEYFVDVTDDCALQSPKQESEFSKNSAHTLPSLKRHKDTEHTSLLACDDDKFLCEEIFDSNVPMGDSRPSHSPLDGSSDYTNLGTIYGLSDFDSLELDTPPDFQLSDIQFGSQDSIFGW